jgi:hypothetical protein
VLEDLAGKVLAESIELVGDQTSRVVRWKEMDGVGALAGQVVRMRVQLKDANLYSFQFH